MPYIVQNEKLSPQVRDALYRYLSENASISEGTLTFSQKYLEPPHNPFDYIYTVESVFEETPRTVYPDIFELTQPEPNEPEMTL